MKLKIIKQETVESTIEIELPYYFEDDYSDEYEESGLYGKMDENEHTIIQYINNDSNGPSKIYIIHQFHQLNKNTKLCEYFQDKHKSNKESYERAKGIAKKFFEQNILK